MIKQNLKVEALSEIDKRPYRVISTEYIREFEVIRNAGEVVQISIYSDHSSFQDIEHNTYAYINHSELELEGFFGLEVIQFESVFLVRLYACMDNFSPFDNHIEKYKHNIMIKGTLDNLPLIDLDLTTWKE